MSLFGPLLMPCLIMQSCCMKIVVWQVMRANYIRSFYLPEHHPSPPSYTSHFKSCKPPHCESSRFCDCGMEKADEEHTQCEVCYECVLVVSCAQQQSFCLKLLLCSSHVFVPHVMRGLQIKQG